MPNIISPYICEEKEIIMLTMSVPGPTTSSEEKHGVPPASASAEAVTAEFLKALNNSVIISQQLFSSMYSHTLICYCSVHE